MQHKVGTKRELNLEEILALFQPVEGVTAFYYGHIRNGKTYSATSDILELLRRGEVVYANWDINFEDYDEREIWWIVLLKSFFGKPLFFKYSKDNFHYFPPGDIDVEFLSRLVGVHIFIDEGQWIFNSHVRNPDPKARELILHNGHYCRSLNIISQRPSNVFKDMRSQIQLWYKCEKVMTFPFLMFKRTTFEDMKEDLPDEEQEKAPVKVYFASKKVLRAYNTHAMRGEDAVEAAPSFEVYDTTRLQRLYMVFSFLIPSLPSFRGTGRRLRRPQATVEAEEDKAPTGIRRVLIDGVIRPREGEDGRT